LGVALIVDDAGSLTIPLNCKPVRIRASLTISHRALVPEHITQILDLKPTQSNRTGEVCPPSRIPRKQGFWVLCSKHLENEADINQHIVWLWNQFREKTSILDQLSAEGYEICIACRFGIAHWNTAISLDVEAISALASFNRPLTLDIYDEQEEDDDDRLMAGSRDNTLPSLE
jgi:Domain of unknown function (DUF4279)